MIFRVIFYGFSNFEAVRFYIIIIAGSKVGGHISKKQ